MQMKEAISFGHGHFLPPDADTDRSKLEHFGAGVDSTVGLRSATLKSFVGKKGRSLLGFEAH